MPDHLVFTLTAAMASFGDLAGHERRGGRDWPGRSAILGLVGAALGLRRTDTEAQARLARDYGVAVAARSRMQALRDFHTVQSVPATIKRPSTRAAALRLAGRRAATSITQRDYHIGAAFDAALWARSDTPRWPLDALCEALEQPYFALWLGRKSCPLTGPLAPRITAGPDVVAVLSVTSPASPHPGLLDTPLYIATDPDGALDPDGARRERRWDQPLDRDRWHFGARDVLIVDPVTT